MSEIEDRVERIEEALVALGVLQFGEGAGHPFRGNQHTGGVGGDRHSPQVAPKSRAEQDHLNKVVADSERAAGIGSQWTAGKDGSIKDIMDHVRELPRGSATASDRVNPQDLRAMGSAAAQLHDTRAYNEATANAPYGDVPHAMTVDGANTAAAAMIREVRDNPEGASTATAQQVARYLDRERGGSTESDQIDWNEVGRNEYV